MANSPTPQNPKEHLQQMNILFFALLAGQLMIVAFMYFFVGKQPLDNGAEMSVASGIDPILIVGCLIFVAAVSASFFMYNKKKVEGAQLSGTLMEKLGHYRTSFVMRAALLEGPNLVMIMLYFFVSSNMIFMVLLAIGIALFLMIRPTADRIAEDYQLSGSEQNELRAAMN